MIDVRVLTGERLEDALDDVARLRISIFAEWPYLYDGDMDYERRYLQHFKTSARAVLVGAYESDWLIGAATGAPLAEHAEEFHGAFEGTDLNLTEVFYCAESVLLPHYRGRGIGHRFFDLREAHAREEGFTKVAFCSVVRPADDPRQPTDYIGHDAFWRGRGYAPLDGVVANFGWKDIGEDKETLKPLQFWMRNLDASAH